MFGSKVTLLGTLEVPISTMDLQEGDGLLSARSSKPSGRPSSRNPRCAPSSGLGGEVETITGDPASPM